MYGAIREHQGPTGVTHALRGRFGPPGASAWGIVFVKSSSLELYNIHANSRHARLNLLAVSSLPSAISSASALRRPSASADFLWLGFSAMRVAALAWDASINDWHTLQAIDLAAVINRMAAAHKTSSRDQQRPMSSVPGDEHRVLIRGRYSDQSTSLLHVDDKGRCVAVLAKEMGLLVVLPMRSDADLAAAASSPSSVEAQDPLVLESEIFSIDLKDEYGVANVKDFVFLDDSFEPTVVLLHEPKRTWAGRVSVLRNTAELVAVSVDLRNRSHTKAWEMKSLPSDADRVVGVPGSAGGGVLVLSPNVLMQVRHEACAAGLSLNSFGDVYAKEMQSTYGAITKSENLMSLDAARCAFLDFQDRSTAMLSLKGGELYHLTVAGSGRNGLSMVRCGSSSIASAIVPINHRFFVLASRIGDSDLIEFCRSTAAKQLPAPADGEAPSMVNPDGTPLDTKGSKESDEKQQPAEVLDLAAATAKKSGKRRGKKRRRTAEEEEEYEMLYGTKPPPESDSESDVEGAGGASTLELEERDEGTRGVYDDEDELELGYGISTSDPKSGTPGSGANAVWSLTVQDRLPCYGPSADFAVGKVTTGDYEGTLDMVVAGGYAKNGCLGILQHALRPEKTLQFDVPGVTQLWTVREPRLSQEEAEATATRIADIAARNRKIAVRNAEQKLAKEQWITEQVASDLEAKSRESDKADEKQEGDGPVSGEPAGKDGAEDKQVPTEPGTKRLKSENGDPMAVSHIEDSGRIPLRQSTGAVKKEPSSSGMEDVDVPGSSGKALPDTSDAERAQKLKTESESLFPMESLIPEEATVPGLHDVHSYLLLSSKTSTAVMSTMHGLDEVDSTALGFCTDMPTLAAGNILGHAVIAQVCTRNARLLKDGKVVAEYSLASGSPAVSSAQIADPFICLVLANGSVLVLKVDAEKIQSQTPKKEIVTDIDAGTSDARGAAENALSAEASPPQYENVTLAVHFALDASQSGSKISSAWIYKGPVSGASKRKLSGNGGPSKDPGLKKEGEGAVGASESDALGAASKSNGEENGGIDLDDMDEEERMLYGDGGGDGSGDDATEKRAVDEGGPGQVDSADQAENIIEEDGSADGMPAAAVDSKVSSEAGVFSLSDSKPELGESDCLLASCTKDGALEIRSMSKPGGCEVIFRCALFFLAPQLAIDDGCEATHGSGGALNDMPKGLKAKKKDRIVSLVMCHVTGNTVVPGISTPLLVAVQASGFPLVYRAFIAEDLSSDELLRSGLRLSRVSCGKMTTSILKESLAGSSSSSIPVMPFSNIAERGGIFVGGKAPFIIVAERGFPRAHALRCAPVVDVASGNEAPCDITSFAEFHGFDCCRGFVYVSNSGVVRRAELPGASAVTTDAPIPFKKVVLRCTPHKIAYHAATQTYGVLASMPTPTTRKVRLGRMLKSLEKHDKRHYESTAAQAEAEKGDEAIGRVPPLFEELHELRVYSPEEGWESVRVEALGVGEVGMSIGNISVDVYKRRSAGAGPPMSVSSKSDDGGESLFAASQRLRAKNMLVVGTGFLNGEDATSRGRLMMFEVSRVEVSKGMDLDGTMRSHTSYQLQAIAQKELPGPVTAVAAMQGYVIAGVGPQLGVYKLVKDESGFEIVHLSFAFGQLFCTSIASVKQYVVSADMYKSVSFHFFRDRNTSVNFLGKDYSHNQSYATEYLIDGSDLSIILSDGEGNIQLLNYAHASVPESRGGKRLLLNGGTNYGSRINKFHRVRLDSDKSEGGVDAGKHATLFVTLDGGIGAILPVSETEFQSVKRLGDVMVSAPDVPRHGGLDPKDARGFKPASNSTQTLHQRLVDTRLAHETVSLSPAQIRAFGTKAELSLDELGKLFSYLESGFCRF